MAKFVFRLQSFLSLKEKLENQKKMDYGQAVAILEQEKKKKETLEQEKRESVLQFKQKIESSIDHGSVRQYNMFISLLKQQITQQEKVILKAEQTVEEKRIILLEAVRERKTLEALKEKARVEYIIEEKKAEQKLTDEVVSYRFNVKAKAEQTKTEQTKAEQINQDYS